MHVIEEAGVARGTELAGRRRGEGEDEQGKHPRATSRLRGQSVGILEGITKNGRRQTRERPYRKTSVLQRQRERSKALDSEAAVAD